MIPLIAVLSAYAFLSTDSVLPISDDEFTDVTGSSNQYGGNADYATVKYNPDGIEQWVAYYNHSGNRNDHAEGIALDSDGNIYVTGSSINYNTQGTYDFARAYPKT